MNNAPDWYDGVALDLLMPRFVGREAWRIAKGLAAESRGRIVPADPRATADAVFARCAPHAEPAERRAALAMAELVQDWADRHRSSRPGLTGGFAP